MKKEANVLFLLESHIDSGERKRERQTDWLAENLKSKQNVVMQFSFFYSQPKRRKEQKRKEERILERRPNEESECVYSFKFVCDVEKTAHTNRNGTQSFTISIKVALDTICLLVTHQ